MSVKVHGRYLDVRLFMEGVECDVTSVKVSCGVNQPGQAIITIPSADAAHHLLPRTLVHLFYFDSRYELGTQVSTDVPGGQSRPAGFYEGNKITEDEGAEISKNIDAGYAALLTDKNDWRNWKLLFTGEVLGYSFKKVGGRREIILVCQDFTSYWDNCRLYWGKKRSSVFNSYKTAVFSGATQLYRGKSKVDSHKDLIRLLQRKPSSMPNVPGLLGGIFSVLESATGSFSPDDKKNYRGCNDFLTQAEVRLKLTRQVGASTKDDTSATFISSKSFRRYLYKISKASSYTATFMQFVNMLMGKIYHVWNSQTAPPYFAEGSQVMSEVVFTDNEKFSYHGTAGLLQKHVKATLKRTNKETSTGDNRRSDVQSGKFKLSYSLDYVKWEIKPDGTPQVDVTNHKKYDKFNANNGVMARAIGSNTTYYTKTSHPNISNQQAANGGLEKHPLWLKGDTVFAKIKKKSKSKTDLSKGRKLRQAYRSAAKAANLCAYLQLAHDRPIPTAHALALGGVSIKYSQKIADNNAEHLRHTADNYNEIRKHCEDALKALRSALGKRTKKQYKKRELVDRLYTTYFHPDLYMCPPPKCNVIFPDQIQSISFSRNWMSEISRLWLHGRSESGRNKKDCYFSPNAMMIAGPKDRECDKAVKKGASFVMGHEKYTGIIPSILGLGDGDIFKKLHKKGIREAKKQAKEDIDAKKRDPKDTFDSIEVSGEAKFSPQPHLQRAANYMFFSARYSTRTMRVTCRYSPQLVAGMPALVLDPVKAESRLQVIDGKERVAKHYIPKGPNTDAASGVKKPDIGPETVKTSIGAIAQSPGTHYVGVIAEIVHIIDVSGGAQTIISLAKCRAYDEAAKIFGDPDEDGEIKVSRTEKKRTWKRESNAVAKIPKKGHGAGLGDPSFKGYDVIDTNTKNLTNFTPKKGVRYRVTSLKDKGGGLDYADANDTSINVKVERLVKWEKTHDDVNINWEATVMPPWFSNIYTPTNIGPEFYQEMYGCGSVLDDAPVSFVPDAAIEKVETDVSEGAKQAAPPSETPTISVLTVKFGDKDSGYKEYKIPEDLTKRSATTKAAADQLASVWLSLKEIGASSDLYIDTYVNRKYASLLEVMGNQNHGLALKIYPESPGPLEYQRAAEQEIVGFHGNAYGPYTGMEDYNGKPLTPSPLIRLTDNADAKPREIDTTIDPRFERYRRVMNYIGDLGRQQFGTGGSYGAIKDAPTTPENGLDVAIVKEQKEQEVDRTQRGGGIFSNRSVGP